MILETVGIKSTCYNCENILNKNEKDLDAYNKGDIVFMYEPNKKRADFKRNIIEK